MQVVLMVWRIKLFHLLYTITIFFLVTFPSHWDALDADAALVLNATPNDKRPMQTNVQVLY